MRFLARLMEVRRARWALTRNRAFASYRTAILGPALLGSLLGAVTPVRSDPTESAPGLTRCPLPRVKSASTGDRAARFIPIETGAAPRGQISGRSIATSVVMDGWRVLAEDGLGLRFVPGDGGHACHVETKRLAGSSGFLPLRGHVRALAAWGGSVYAAVEGGPILVIDAAHPENPAIIGSIPHPSAGGDSSPVESLDVLGTTLYVLTRDRLEILNTDALGMEPQLHPEVRGLAIRAEGRLLRVVRDDGTTVTYRDTSTTSQRFDVAVDSNFYKPESIAVDVGDTVRWTNLTGEHHNVFSCTADQTGCAGAAAAEAFQSGSPTGFFVYDHTFVVAGGNRYICQPHAPFMVGTVTVTGSAGTPPGVPDGTMGSPLRAEKLTADGSMLSISWDTTSCTGAADHEILYGYSYSLPPATGGGYEPAGSRCSIGTTSPFVWTGVPPAFPGSSGFVWWLIIATDGASTEGSWGKASSGLERQGPGAGGSSLECGIVKKSLVNTCAQAEHQLNLLEVKTRLHQ